MGGIYSGIYHTNLIGTIVFQPTQSIIIDGMRTFLVEGKASSVGFQQCPKYKIVTKIFVFQLHDNDCHPSYLVPIVQ